MTPEDFKKLIEVLKEFFYSKEEMDFKHEELRKDFRNLQNSVDAYAKKADTYYQEMAVMRHKLERMEDWIVKASSKIGVEFKV
jgi:uncharacterized coiled-coil DUF342 family protein